MLNLRHLTLAVLLTANFYPMFASGQGAKSKLENRLRGEWSLNHEPFRIIGNIYYVGAQGISSYLIDTGSGLILLDTGTREMQGGLRRNIACLGFKFTDIKIILSSHAHFDHVEGHSDVQRNSGAKVMALGADADAIKTGKDTTAFVNPGLTVDWMPTPVDRKLQDNDTVTLGNVTMKAHLTAGHTKGCTTWTMNVQDGGKDYLVVFYGGVSAKGIHLLDNKDHPNIRDDFERSFQFLESLKPDVYLTQHPWGLSDKFEQLKKLQPGMQNPFIDPSGYKELICKERKKFEETLREQRAERSKEAVETDHESCNPNHSTVKSRPRGTIRLRSILFGRGCLLLKGRH
jgi:metallo-beta-lactamase class B